MTTSIDQLQELFRRVGALERGRSPESATLLTTRQPQAQEMLLGKPVADLQAGSIGDFAIWSSIIVGPEPENPTGEISPGVKNRAFPVTTEDLCYLAFVDGRYESSKAVC